MFSERNSRSLAKAISWRIVATLTTVLLVYAFTDDLVLSVGIGSVEFMVKVALYYGHERLWSWIKWGYR